ncbi:hypothetical protein Tco_0236234 [Tanacetum coccineum]
MGDTNTALFLADSTASSSNMDISMRDFKDCVANIEVMDMQQSGLQYTWSQKPKGLNGILKKLDRIIANLEFTDIFVVALDMVREVSKQEVKEDMFSMGDNKSPGPDGYSVTFFKEAWEIVGDDVTNAICEFFTNGTLLKELNHTIIALIPKVKSPSRIMECVTSTSYSICINGSLHGYFQGKQGLRQGDPLSPYIFTLVIEILTLIINRMVLESGMFTYHRYCSKLELVNLCFANDLFIFSYGDVQSATVIKEALEEFKLVSGLVPSLPKSTAYFCNVLNHIKISILHILPFEEGCLPVKYLGSMHIYWASVFMLPSRVLLDIEQFMRGFIWCQGDMKKGKAKVVWEVVCLLKDEGGLGLRRLEHFNSALMISHVWKLLSFKESLWVKWIHAYKLNGQSFFDVPISGNVSWGWQKIIQL